MNTNQNFIEFIVDDKHHIINVDNIAMIKQLDQYTLEVYLLTKDKNAEQIHFKWAWTLGDVKHKMTVLEKFMYPAPFVVSTK